MIDISRRNLLQLMGAAAFAGPMAMMSKAYAARDKELNILCWEGYNRPRCSIRSAPRKARR